MKNENFERLLELSIKNFGENYIDVPEDMKAPHEFSTCFERKMNKLISRQRKPYYILVSTAGRRAAVIAVSILVAGGAAMSVKAIREKVIEFITVQFSKYDKVCNDIDNNSSYPTKIEQEYAIDVPEGFVLDENESTKTEDYVFKKYVNGDKYIQFYQYTQYYFSMDLDNERNREIYNVYDNGILYTVYFWKNNNNCIIIWKNDNYVFYVDSNLDKDELVNLCIHTKIK